MMAVPARDLGDLLVADWAESSLFFPQGKQPVFPLKSRCHLNVETFFKVAFPCRVIRVGFPLGFDVSDDRHACRADEVTCVFLRRAEKDPVISLDGCEVLLRLPCLRFSLVSSVHPSPDGLIDPRIANIEGFIADDVLVIVRLTANHRGEFGYQILSSPGSVSLQHRSDY